MRSFDSKVTWLGLAALALASAEVTGCESSDSTPQVATGGGAATTAGSGGTSGAGSGSGGTSALVAGSTSTGGSLGGGGMGVAGSGTSGSESGGMSGGAGSAGSAGQGGGSTGPLRSAGCGKTSPAQGEAKLTVQGKAGVYFISTPSDYDAQKPYPLVFGFHGRNLTYKDCLNANCAGLRAAAGDEAVLVYMSSIGTGWEGDGEREVNVEFFQTMLQKMKAEYCLDENRVFVTGSSSGAQFTNILACRFGDVLRGAAPVAGATLEKDNCKGSVAAMVIHGVDDYHVTFAAGQGTRDTFLMRNGCSMNTDKPLGPLHDSVVQKRESHDCTAYQGCKAPYPVTWCEHSEGGYDGSTHGWPLFAGGTVWDFFKALPPDGN